MIAPDWCQCEAFLCGEGSELPVEICVKSGEPLQKFLFIFLGGSLEGCTSVQPRLKTPSQSQTYSNTERGPVPETE